MKTYLHFHWLLDVLLWAFHAIGHYFLFGVGFYLVLRIIIYPLDTQILGNQRTPMHEGDEIGIFGAMFLVWPIAGIIFLIYAFRAIIALTALTLILWAIGIAGA